MSKACHIARSCKTQRAQFKRKGGAAANCVEVSDKKNGCEVQLKSSTTSEITVLEEIISNKKEILMEVDAGVNNQWRNVWETSRSSRIKEKSW